ncbi:hypothetical protein [Oryza sativa Japonica Group]|uniref:Os01g0171600 protein n=2 Tax=Oryza sativa subsp. japonica TaxID=39947 RepID=Q5VQL6_ORYSJ|nr:hypothetical protein [Oryza sativa Japonica Group]BAS70626.1 Os01g0171600 [Oryza sativa Japonica Group]
MNGGACTDADGRRDDRQGDVVLRPPRPVEADASHAVGGYMSLLMLVSMHMHLFLQRAPYAVLKDLLDVGVKRIGIATVLVFLSCLGLSFGVTWVAIALDCVYLVIIAHVLAIWVRLVRTYALRD